MGDFDSDLEHFVSQAMPVYREQLGTLVGIPSISAEPKHRGDIDKVVEVMRTYASAFGFQADVIQTPGNPILVARLEVDPSAPWANVYNHLDVQPAEEVEWTTDPFNPVVNDEMIIGRGATDDKGPALTILHAIHFLQRTGRLRTNVQLTYETEEEIGSDNFGSFLDQNQILTRPDSVLISDTTFEGDNPAITYRLRGVVTALLRRKTGTKWAHSGSIGNLAKNPLTILSYAAAQCIDVKTGEVLIPGFYDGMLEPTARERENIYTLLRHFDLAKFKDDMGCDALYTDDPREALLRKGFRPSFEIHGNQGGYNGDGVKTVIPYDVEVKVSMRLVPGQDPKRVLEFLRTYMKSIDPAIEVIGGHGIPACMTQIDSLFIERATEACTYGFGKPALRIAEGGSIGATTEFQRVWPKVPIVMLAQSLNSDGYHAPNEHFRFSQAAAGMKTMARYLSSIGDLRTAR